MAWKKKPLKYLTRSYRHLEREGYLVDVAERRITPFLSKDMFGFFDLVAISPDNRLIGIQVTSGNCYRAHVEKLEKSPEIERNMKRWAQCGGKIEAHIWRKRKSGRHCDVYTIEYYADLDGMVWSREGTFDDHTGV